MTTNDFIQQCENSGKFNYEQIQQIRWGFQQGLTIEQIKLYADTKFKWEQMQEVRIGFESGLTREQVKLYANPEFEWFEMNQIYKFIKENNITDMSTKTIRFLIGLGI